MIDREKLKRLRKALRDDDGKQMSQDKLSKEIGLYSGTISRIERGISQDPDPATVAKIAEFFGLSRDDLYVKSNKDGDTRRSPRDIEKDVNDLGRRYGLSRLAADEVRRVLEQAPGSRSDAAEQTQTRSRKGARGGRNKS